MTCRNRPINYAAQQERKNGKQYPDDGGKAPLHGLLDIGPRPGTTNDSQRSEVGCNPHPPPKKKIRSFRKPRTLAPPKNKYPLRTGSLDGGHDQVTGNDLTDLRGPPGPTSESLLQFANEEVAEGRGHEQTVHRHLYGTRIDLGACERMGIEWGILGRLTDGNVG